MTPLAFRLVPYEPHCNYATTRHEISRDNEGDPVWLQPGVISICFHVSIIEKINEWKLFSCVELPWLIGQLVDISIEMVLTGWPSILLNSGLNIKLLVSSHEVECFHSTSLLPLPLTLSSLLGLAPAAVGPVTWGRRESRVSNSILASAIWLAMSALKCWPNTSGCSVGGSMLMKSWYEDWGPSRGM